MLPSAQVKELRPGGEAAHSAQLMGAEAPCQFRPLSSSLVLWPSLLSCSSFLSLFFLSFLSFLPFVVLYYGSLATHIPFKTFPAADLTNS